MATKVISESLRSLLKAKESAEQRLRELDAERKELRASLKSLSSAIRALERDTKSDRHKNALRQIESANVDES